MSSIGDVIIKISNISDFSDALPFVAWVWFGNMRKPYRILGLFFLFCFVIRSYTFVTAEKHFNNMPAYHLLALVEISAVYCFYCELVYGKVFTWGLILLIIFHLANTIFYQEIHSFNSVAWTADMILIITIGLSYFVELYKNENDFTPLQTRPDFVITVGWLLYASGSLFTYLMGSEVLSRYAKGLLKDEWFFQIISNISKDVIISYGFWLTRKK